VDGHGGLAATLGIESSGGVRLAAIGGGGGRVEIVEQGGAWPPPAEPSLQSRSGQGWRQGTQGAQLLCKFVLRTHCAGNAAEHY
jgi:hypothetical protein